YSQLGIPYRYGTIRSFVHFDFTDHTLIPRKGFRWNSQVNFFRELGGNKGQYFQLSSDLSVYASPGPEALSLAFRIGAASNTDGYQFFQANTLGGNTNLRGYRNNRFSNGSYLYQNSEVRLKVLNIRNYIFTGNIGLFAFLDAGRVY